MAISSKTRDRWRRLAATMAFSPLLLTGCSTAVAPESNESIPSLTSNPDTSSVGDGASGLESKSAANSSADTPYSSELDEVPDTESSFPLLLQPDLHILGHFLVDRASDDVVPVVENPATFILPGKDPVRVDAEELFPDREILHHTYTSAGAAGTPLVVTAIQYRKPAEGLQEEKYITSLVAVDPETAEILRETEVYTSDSVFDEFHNLTGSSANVVALSYDMGEEDDMYTEFYDVITGEQVLKIDGSISAPVIGAVAVMGDGTSDCGAATGYDVATAKKLYSLDYSKLGPDCESAGPAEYIPLAVLTGEAERQQYVRHKSNDGQAIFDAATGEPRHLPDTVVAIDPLDNLATGWSSDTSSLDPHPIDFMDTTTGKILWSLSAEKATKLSASVEALHAGIAYIGTTDGIVRVDAHTGNEIDNKQSDVGSVLPVGVVDGWTYWDNGKLSPPPASN